MPEPSPQMDTSQPTLVPPTGPPSTPTTAKPSINGQFSTF
jgi:hypothetical protein